MEGLNHVWGGGGIYLSTHVSPVNYLRIHVVFNLRLCAKPSTTKLQTNTGDQWLALLTHDKRLSGSNPGQTNLRSLHLHPLTVESWVESLNCASVRVNGVSRVMDLCDTIGNKTGERTDVMELISRSRWLCQFWRTHALGITFTKMTRTVRRSKNLMLLSMWV